MAALSTDPETNPFYYLDYLEYLLAFVRERYRHLLRPDEESDLDAFFACSKDARALYARLLTRKPVYFRVDKLFYPEIGDLTAAIDELITGTFLVGLETSRPDLEVSMRTKLELKRCGALAAFNLTHASRQEIDRVLSQGDFDFPQLQIVRQGKRDLMTICQHLFFGNQYQQLDEFIRTDLGQQTFESVDLSLTPSYRCRADFDHARLLGALRQWAHTLEADSRQLKRSPDAVAKTELLTQLTSLRVLVPDRSRVPALSRSHDKLCLLLGQSFERLGDIEQALSSYRGVKRAPSRERQARLQVSNAEVVRRLCLEILEDSTDASESSFARQQLQKQGALPLNQTTHGEPEIPSQALVLTIDPLVNIEQQVINYYRENGIEARHVENHLFPGLFGILFWEVIFLPVQGAFHHPFEREPADLYEPDFYSLRAKAFEDRFKILDDCDYRRAQCAKFFCSKQGVVNPFVYWPAITLDLLEHVLSATPWSALKTIFRQLLKDPKAFRKGFPDLVVLHADRYELIEVKGPGDRLQKHQIGWLQRFLAQKIDASVLYIRAAEDDANPLDQR